MATKPASSGGISGPDRAAIAANTGGINSLVALSGMAGGSVHFSTFSGDILSDDETAKVLFQELETAIESIVTGIADDTYGDIVVTDSGATWTIDAGTIDEGKLADGAVTEAKIADDAVTTDKVLDAAITSDKIADDAVTSGKIADSAVVEAGIANSAVTEVKIADDAVTAAKIADNAVVEAGIANNAVTQNKVLNSAISLGKIQNIATASFLGRLTGDTGVVEVLSAANVLSILGINSVGSGTIISSAERTKIGHLTVNGSINLDDIPVAKIEDFAQYEILGKVTTGSGAPSKLTPSEVLTCLGITYGSGTIISSTERTNLGALATLSGVAAGSTHMGTFTGGLYSDNKNIKELFQETETIVEAIISSGVPNGDKGDILVTGSGATWTIDSGVVTLAKMANLATARLIGRTSSGTGVPEALTPADGRTVLQLNDVGLTRAALGLDGGGTVDDTGALQTLLDAGGTIRLPAGTYKVTWTGTPEVFGLRMKKAGTRLIGAGKGQTIISLHPTASPAATTTHGLRLQAFGGDVPNDCLISDLTIRVDALVNEGKIMYALRADSADRLRLRDIEVVGPATATYTNHGGYVHGNQGAIHCCGLSDCDYVDIENSEFRESAGEEFGDWGSFGLELEDCQNVMARNCEFDHNYFDGVKLLNTSNRCENIVFDTCKFSRNGTTVEYGVTDSGGTVQGNGNGIDIDAKGRVRLINCLAESNYGGNIQVKCNDISDVSISYCTSRFAKTSTGNKQAGIIVFIDSGTYLTNTSTAVMAPLRVTIDHCSVYENDGDGIAIQKAVECIIDHNIVRSNGLIGINLQENAVRCTVDHNHVLGNGLTSTAGTSYGIFVSGGGHIIDGNWISGIDTLYEGDEDQADYRANTPITDRGIQQSTSTNNEPNVIRNNYIEELFQALYIQISGGTAYLEGNYQSDGTTVLRMHDGIYPQAVADFPVAGGRRTSIPLTSLRRWESVQELLPTTASGTDLALIPGTWATSSPIVRTADVKNLGATNHYARILHTLRPEYHAGQTVRVRLYGGMITTLASTSATFDVVAYEPDKAGGISGDLCATAPISINSSLTHDNRDFTITPTNLRGGEILDIRLHIAINDSGTGTAVIGQIGAIEIFD